MSGPLVTATLPVLLRRRAEQDPDGVLIELVDGHGGDGYRNAEFHAAALRTAHGLRGLGVGAGDRVAVMPPAEPVAHVLWIAVAWLRALEVPVNPEFRGDFLRHILADSGATVLVTTADRLPALDELAGGLPELRHIVLVDGPDGAGSSGLAPVHRLADLPGDTEEIEPEPSERDAYSVIYTSGTTGPAKGVVMPWANLHVSAAQMFPDDDPADHPGGAFYSPWPTFHSSGKIALLYAAELGLRLVMRPRFSVGNFWPDVRAHRCTHAHLIGLAGYLLAAEPRPDDADNPLHRVLVNPMPPDFRVLEKRFDVRVSTGWGMTEIGFPVSTGTPEDGTGCGRLSPLYEARLVDEHDYDVPDGEVGELVIRTHRPWLMLDRYLGRPEATARAWRNGWFHTGDALRRKGDGDYFFVDRVADYVRTRGNNVSSLEVESQVRAHPDVADCACVGVPAESGGEQDVKIVVVPRPGAAPDAEDLLAFLAHRMPRYMLPRHVAFADELPRTPTGKIRKSALRG